MARWPGRPATALGLKHGTQAVDGDAAAAASAGGVDACCALGTVGGRFTAGCDATGCAGSRAGDVVRSIDGTAAKDPTRWPDILGPGTRPSALEVERSAEVGTRVATLGQRG